MTLDLDDTDRGILHILQTDGKASIQEIADTVALSTSRGWRRIRRMERAGLIIGYTARLTPSFWASTRWPMSSYR